MWRWTWPCLVAVAACATPAAAPDGAPPSGPPSASVAPVHAPRPPPAAKSLVLSHERPPLHAVALASPIAIIARVGAVDDLARCDCQQARLEIVHVLLDATTLGLQPSGSLQVARPGDELGRLTGQPRLWLLRPEPGSERIEALHHLDPSARSAIEPHLSDFALSFERDEAAEPALALVTTRAGLLVQHRRGRVAVIGELEPAERAAQDALLARFQSLTASENPTAAAPERHPVRLRIAGSGAEGDVTTARRALEVFSEGVHARLALARSLWRATAVVRVHAATARGEVIIDEVLRDASAARLAPGDALQPVGGEASSGQRLLVLGALDPPRASVLASLPLAEQARVRQLLDAQRRHRLFALPAPGD
ncbi:MAG: hypothetical protein KF718_17160 [Polyangiaceae bacterium]|nr:hypothetical protein [Polyangiaceae bacterium]